MALTAALIHYPFVLSGFEIHHQGLMLASAIGVQEGGVVHSEIFSQYGPVVPLSQAAFQFLPFSPAINLALWAVACIAGISYTLTLFSFRVPAAWRMPKYAGATATAIWLSLSITFIEGRLWSWPSLLATLVSISSAYLLVAGMGVSSETGRSRQNRTLLIAGFGFGLLPFIRLDVGLATWAVLLVFAAIPSWRKQIAFAKKKPLLTGFLMSTTGTVASLLSTGGLLGFVSQSVVVPVAAGFGRDHTFSYFVSEISQGFGSLFPRVIPLLIAATLAGLLLGLRPKHQMFRFLVRGFQSLLLFLATVFAAGLQDWLLGLTLALARGTPLDGHSAGITGATIENLLTLCLFIGLTFPVIGLLRVSSKARNRMSPKGVGATVLMVYLIALANMAQFFPLADTRHLWWGLPLLLLMGIWGTATVAHTSNLHNFLWLPSLAIVILVGSINAVNALALSTVTSSPGSIVEGVKTTREVASFLASTSQLLSDHLEPTERAFFATVDGVVAVADGQFRADNLVFVSWGNQEPSQITGSNGSGKVVVDAPSLAVYEAKSFQHLAAKYNLQVLDCSNDSYQATWDNSAPYICILERRKP